MSATPDSPREFVAWWLKPYLVDGKLAFKSRDIDADKFMDDLAVRFAENESGEIIADISNDQAERLLLKSLDNKQVEKKGRIIASINLLHLGPLPPGLRVLAAYALADALPKGTQGRKRGDNYERDRWIHSTAKLLVIKFDLHATRSEASADTDADTGEEFVPVPSACDYIAEALKTMVDQDMTELPIFILIWKIF